MPFYEKGTPDLIDLEKQNKEVGNEEPAEENKPGLEGDVRP